MAGGLMQLVAYGAQDVYLTGQPQITFFKVTYKRHTNFSIEAIEQTFNGAADWGRKVTCTVSRNGDLIHRTYIQVTLPDVTVPVPSIPTMMNAAYGFRWVDWVGHALIKSVEIEIGGQRMDKHYGEWLHIWNELTQTAGKVPGYANMVGNIPSLTNLVVVNTNDAAPAVVPGETLYIPLQFWFCRNPGLALPLIALQYHEIKFSVELRDWTDCCWFGQSDTAGANRHWYTNYNIVSSFPSIRYMSMFIDYMYLDTEERRKFAQSSHEYLYEQLQFTGDESFGQQTTPRVKMNYNHPCKELIWVLLPDANVCNNTPFGKQHFNFTDEFDRGFKDSSYRFGTKNDTTNYISAATPGDNPSGNNPILTAKIQLNGHDRFAERDGRYFNLVQPYQHHENIPSRGINLYSFALKPEEHQPTGTCNMSRIDNATLLLTLSSKVNRPSTPAAGWPPGTPNTCKLKIFATNYNVLRIMSGMGGLAYAN